MNREIIDLDVDTGKDFMLKNGALYVPEAEDIIENIKLLTEESYRRGR